MTLEIRNQKSEIRLSGPRGYTLVELMVSVGLFAMVVLLTSGAYLMMIGISRQAQSITTGINNLSFALETMTRTIRTGTDYSCDSIGDCTAGTTFSVINSNDKTVEYSLSSGNTIMQRIGTGALVPLTDPSVKVTSLIFYASGTASDDDLQPHVTIIVSGEVPYGPGPEQKKSFTIETGATMRGTDI